MLRLGRNGISKKILLSEDGSKLEIQVPRDRTGEFDPQFIRKGQRRFGGFDQKIIAMYAQGMTVEEQTRNGIFCTPRVNPPTSHERYTPNTTKGKQKMEALVIALIATGKHPRKKVQSGISSRLENDPLPILSIVTTTCMSMRLK